MQQHGDARTSPSSMDPRLMGEVGKVWSVARSLDSFTLFLPLQRSKEQPGLVTLVAAVTSPESELMI